ncbi:serine hydrolase [Nocardioides sp. SYSU D00038]|uniref:serine hydrolase domain-containing protein n=1 Tax=Nocardioides sp. SYSU D00038 TaxID=2812554 RepID=UPI0019679B37|nr:serine hydrolase domain-containing protein [Nocardioides sp. SYSU D00038]
MTSPSARRLAGATGLLLALGLFAACSDDPPAADLDASESPSATDDPSASADPSGGASPTGEWPRAEPEDLGFDAGRLDEVADEANRFGSSCFVVTRKGSVVGEWNWDDGDVLGSDPRDVYSVTKTVAGILVGIAQADGDLDISDPVSDYVSEWRGTDSAEVTIRDLLTNTSGRFWTPKSDYEDLFAAPDRTRYAVGLGQATEPGEEWIYNNAAIQVLDRVLREATGEDPADFARKRLFAPLGMLDTELSHDDSGRSTNLFFGMTSTCLDLARLGQLYADGGSWYGEQVVPRSWVTASTRQSAPRLNAGYGYLWWLNRKGPLVGASGTVEATDEQLAPDSPERFFAMLGLGGQVVMVDPRTHTVVVRLGDPGPPPQYSMRHAAPALTYALTEPGAG